MRNTIHCYNINYYPYWITSCFRDWEYYYHNQSSIQHHYNVHWSWSSMIVCMGFPENLKSSSFKQIVSEMVMNCQLHKMMKNGTYVRIWGVHSGLTTSLQIFTLICEKFTVESTGLVLQINVWRIGKKELCTCTSSVTHKLTVDLCDLDINNLLSSFWSLPWFTNFSDVNFDVVLVFSRRIK